MDEKRRELERQAATDDPEAQTRLKIARCRAGECCYHDTPLGERSMNLHAEVDITHTNDESDAALTISTRGDADQVRNVLNAILEVVGLAPLVPEDITQVKCGYCGAESGEWCITKSGKKASALHTLRGRSGDETYVNENDERYDADENPIYGEDVYAAVGFPYPPPRRPARRRSGTRSVEVATMDESGRITAMPFLNTLRDPLAPPPENIHMRMQPGQTVTIQQPDGTELTMEF